MSDFWFRVFSHPCLIPLSTPLLTSKPLTYLLPNLPAFRFRPAYRIDDPKVPGVPVRYFTALTIHVGLVIAYLMRVNISIAIATMGHGPTEVWGARKGGGRWGIDGVASIDATPTNRRRVGQRDRRYMVV